MTASTRFQNHLSGTQSTYTASRVQTGLNLGPGSLLATPTATSTEPTTHRVCTKGWHCLPDYTPSGILTTVYNFCSESGCADGESPEGALLESSDGLVYGTTNIGGNTGTCDTPSGCGTVFSLSGVTPNPNQFVPVTPCRLVDTRSGNGGNGAIQAGSFAIFDVRQLSLTNGCGDLSSATAYSLNLTLIPKDHQSVYYDTLWPTGDNQPWVSTMKSPDGST